MKSGLMTRSFRFNLLLCSIGIITGCAPLRQIAPIQKPQVQVRDLEITGLDFHHLDLSLHLNVQNPNAIGIRLAGLDYEFQVEKTPLLFLAISPMRFRSLLEEMFLCKSQFLLLLKHFKKLSLCYPERTVRIIP